MGTVIGESQSAFLSGRNIMDGVAILNEAIEDAKKRKTKRIIFKVDFAKAYDSIDWGFLIDMMKRLSFSPRWIKWIKECISTATANVLVNGSPAGEFPLERGVRQGDPLSPFLFLIVAEGLSLLIDRAVRFGLLKPAEVGKDRVKLTHLQYADDTLFVVEGSEDNARAIKSVLKIFEVLSGLSVNFDKCCVIGLNMTEQEVDFLKELLGCQKGVLPINYLGMKVGGGLSRLANWDGLVEKTRKRLKGWSVKSLSLGGRVTVINSVLSAIPTFRMAFAPIPAGTSKILRSLQRKFLWGEEEGGAKKISWVKWDEVCRDKKEGGLGVKDLKIFNLALLGKWCWRFIREKNSLWVKVVRSRYGSKADAFKHNEERPIRGARGGWWNRVLAAVVDKHGQWFSMHLRKIIGNGMDTKFWADKWCGDQPLKQRYPRLFHICASPEGLVGEMGAWVEGSWSWDIKWRRPLNDRDRVLVEDLMQKISANRLVATEHDRWSWGEAGHGEYAVRKAYALIARTNDRAMQNRQEGLGFNSIWKAIAPFKHRIMAWRVLRNRLPSRDNLHTRLQLGPGEMVCTCCETANESLQHLFLQCDRMVLLWNRIVDWVGVVWAAPSNIDQHLASFVRLLRGKATRRLLGGLWICVIWVMWKWRNKCIFEKWTWDAKLMEDEIKQRWWSWCMVKGHLGSNASFLEWTRTNLCMSWRCA